MSLLRLAQDGCKHQQVPQEEILFEGGERCGGVLMGEEAG